MRRYSDAQPATDSTFATVNGCRKDIRPGVYVQSPGHFKGVTSPSTHLDHFGDEVDWTTATPYRTLLETYFNC